MPRERPRGKGTETDRQASREGPSPPPALSAFSLAYGKQRRGVPSCRGPQPDKAVARHTELRTLAGKSNAVTRVCRGLAFLPRSLEGDLLTLPLCTGAGEPATNMPRNTPPRLTLLLFLLLWKSPSRSRPALSGTPGRGTTWSLFHLPPSACCGPALNYTIAYKSSC